jgi:aspartate/methionine/tyrosine aminotransferase
LRDIARVRAIVLRELQTLGDACEVPPAEGAFYFLLRLRGGGDPLALCERLIRDHGVAVIPGNAFGLSTGCHLRVAYAALQEKTVMEGVGRLVNGLKTLVPA